MHPAGSCAAQLHYAQWFLNTWRCCGSGCQFPCFVAPGTCEQISQAVCELRLAAAAKHGWRQGKLRFGLHAAIECFSHSSQPVHSKQAALCSTLLRPCHDNPNPNICTVLVCKRPNSPSIRYHVFCLFVWFPLPEAHRLVRKPGAIRARPRDHK